MSFDYYSYWIMEESQNDNIKTSEFEESQKDKDVLEQQYKNDIEVMEIENERKPTIPIKTKQSR